MVDIARNFLKRPSSQQRHWFSQVALSTVLAVGMVGVKAFASDFLDLENLEGGKNRFINTLTTAVADGNQKMRSEWLFPAEGLALAPYGRDNTLVIFNVRTNEQLGFVVRPDRISSASILQDGSIGFVTCNHSAGPSVSDCHFERVDRTGAPLSSLRLERIEIPGAANIDSYALKTYDSYVAIVSLELHSRQIVTIHSTIDGRIISSRNFEFRNLETFSTSPNTMISALDNRITIFSLPNLVEIKNFFASPAPAEFSGGLVYGNNIQDLHVKGSKILLTRYTSVSTTKVYDVWDASGTPRRLSAQALGAAVLPVESSSGNFWGYAEGAYPYIFNLEDGTRFMLEPPTLRNWQAPSSDSGTWIDIYGRIYDLTTKKYIGSYNLNMTAKSVSASVASIPLIFGQEDLISQPLKNGWMALFKLSSRLFLGTRRLNIPLHSEIVSIWNDSQSGAGGYIVKITDAGGISRQHLSIWENSEGMFTSAPILRAMAPKNVLGFGVDRSAGFKELLLIGFEEYDPTIGENRTWEEVWTIDASGNVLKTVKSPFSWENSHAVISKEGRFLAGLSNESTLQVYDLSGSAPALLREFLIPESLSRNQYHLSANGQFYFVDQSASYSVISYDIFGNRLRTIQLPPWSQESCVNPTWVDLKTSSNAAFLGISQFCENTFRAPFRIIDLSTFQELGDPDARLHRNNINTILNSGEVFSDSLASWRPAGIFH